MYSPGPVVRCHSRGQTILCSLWSSEGSFACGALRKAFPPGDPVGAFQMRRSQLATPLSLFPPHARKCFHEFGCNVLSHRAPHTFAIFANSAQSAPQLHTALLKTHLHARVCAWRRCYMYRTPDCTFFEVKGILRSLKHG